MSRTKGVDWFDGELIDISPDNDNWNERYQEIMSKPENSSKEKLEKYTLLYGLNKDFITSATSYAKTIISEYFLEEELKSIHLQQIGGYAGGKKFLWRGILFKLAYGEWGPYTGNDEAAARAMGNELKGGNSYFRCAIPGLNVALQALIDYKGFRMHAQVLLPINRETLKVGTADAGKEVHADCEELLHKMKQAAEELNIREHVIKDKVLYSGCDVEGHLGVDGNFYLVDLSRSFPPESPLFTKHFDSNSGISPGEILTLSFSSESPYLPDGCGRTVPQLNYEKTPITVQGVVYSYHSDDDSYEIRIRFPAAGADPEYTLRLSTQDIMSCLSSMNPSEFLAHSQQNRGMSIFWRLLRPEFVKHRGSHILTSIYEIHRRSNSKVVTPIRPKEDTKVNEIISTETGTEGKTGYSEGFQLGPSPEMIKLMKSFSSPGSSTQNCQINFTSRQISYSAGDAKNFQEFSQTTTLEDDQIDTEDSLDSLPPAPLLFRRESSGPMYHVMPDPEIFPPSSSRRKSYSEDDILSTGCNLERQLSDLIDPPRLEQKSLAEADSGHENILSVTTRDVLQQFELLTGSSFSPSHSFPSPPLSADALSSFSKSDPESSFRNQEIHLATLFLLRCVIPGLAIDLMVRGHPMEREGLSITEFMHKQGVNIRHAGLLRHLILISIASSSQEQTVSVNVIEEICRELLNEVVSRTLKNILRQTQRVWMSQLRTTSEHGMLQLIVRFFNLITGYHHSSMNFWNHIVIPGIISRFGRVSLTDKEMGLLDSNERRTLNQDFTDQQLKQIIKMVASSTGVFFSKECLHQLETTPTKFFEFTISDIAEMKPVVKHMHQMDFAEGLMLSLKGQEKENKNENSGVIVRLMTLAIDKLHAALKAVPDDTTTKYALADAYQTLAFAEWQKEIHSIPTSPVLTSHETNKNDERVTEHQQGQRGEEQEASHQLQTRTSSISKGFELYRSLICDETHTRCSKLKLSYRDDVLGICIVLKHFHSGKNSNNHSKRHPKEANPSHHRNHNHFIRIQDVTVYLQCISLTYFQKYLRKLHSSPVPAEAAAADTSGPHEGVNDKEEFTEKKELICGIKCHSKGKRRFFPLIVNEEHAERAYELLCEEIVRSDQLTDQEYESPLNLEVVPHGNGQGQGQGQGNVYHIKKYQPIMLPEFNCQIALRVISAVMNSMVVMFSTNAMEGKISDPALVGFSRFHHMLLYLAKKHPQMTAEANNSIEKFLSHKVCRYKMETPDLGRLLVYLLLSDRGWDAQFRDAYLEEALSRQVSWFAKEHKHPELLVLETDPIAVYRLKTTFNATLSSLRTVMFQIYFLQSIARKFVNSSTTATASGNGGLVRGETTNSMNRRNDDIVLKLYNASLGRPTAAMRTNYQQEFEAIVNVSNYEEFLDRLGCEYTPEQMTVLLRNAVRAACMKHYGGLKLMDIVGNTVVETFPKGNEFGSVIGMTWKELNDLSSVSFEEIKTTNRRKWLDRQKELRKQEKVRGESSIKANQTPSTGMDSNLKKNQKSPRQHSEAGKVTGNLSAKGQDLRKEGSWGVKDWGRSPRRLSEEFDSINQSAQPILRQRSDTDSNWRKR